MKGVPLKARLAVTLLFAAFLLATPTANAELSAHGDLFVRFDGGIAPRALPRHTPAPITVSVSGTVRTLSGARPPALRQIRIAINRNGQLDSRGLPSCPPARIEATTSKSALALCRSALVGSGSFAAATAYPEQFAFPTRGRILAFNSRVGCSASQRPGRAWPSRSRTQGGRQGERTSVRDPQAADRGRRDATCHGRPAILAHVYGTQPLPISRLISFRIRRPPGPYGIVLTATLPASINPHGYVKHIALRLHRTFYYRGRRRSYLSAACAAPAGFPGASFAFAQTSMSFADGRSLSSTLVRSCWVRD